MGTSNSKVNTTIINIHINLSSLGDTEGHNHVFRKPQEDDGSSDVVVPPHDVVVLLPSSEQFNSTFACCSAGLHHSSLSLCCATKTAVMSSTINNNVATSLLIAEPPKRLQSLPPNSEDKEAYPAATSMVMCGTVSIAVLIVTNDTDPSLSFSEEDLSVVNNALAKAFNFLNIAGGIKFSPRMLTAVIDTPASNIPVVLSDPPKTSEYEFYEQPWRDAAFKELGFLDTTSTEAYIAFAQLAQTTKAVDANVVDSFPCMCAFSMVFTKYPCATYAYSLGASNTRCVIQFKTTADDVLYDDMHYADFLSVAIVREMARIFGATDEATGLDPSKGATKSGVYKIPNYNNAENTTSTAKVNCIMKNYNGLYNFCFYSRAQIGWPWFSYPDNVQAPASANGAPVNLLSYGALSACEFDGRAYLFLCKPTTQVKLLWTCSSDACKDTWSQWQPISDYAITLKGPCSSLVFDGKLYFFFMGSSASDTNIYYISKSSHTASWSSYSVVKVMNGTTTTTSVAAIPESGLTAVVGLNTVANPKGIIFLFYKRNGYADKIFLTKAKAVNGVLSWYGTINNDVDVLPATTTDWRHNFTAVAFGSDVVLAYTDISYELFIGKRSFADLDKDNDGTWDKAVSVGHVGFQSLPNYGGWEVTVFSMAVKPATVEGDAETLYLFMVGRDDTNRLQFRSTSDLVYWTEMRQPIPQGSTYNYQTYSCVTSIYFKNSITAFFKESFGPVRDAVKFVTGRGV